MICEPANKPTHAKGTILMTQLLRAAQGVAMVDHLANKRAYGYSWNDGT